MSSTKPQIFVIQPFGKETDAVFQLIASAAANAGVSVLRADTMTAGTNIVQTILEVIQKVPLLVADVTHANPNVMYEVGFAQAQKKPLILIAGTSSSIPFDLTGARVLIYDLRNPLEFVERLAKTIGHALKAPGEFLFSQVIADREKRQSVFISYSHRDRDYLDRLLVQLKPLEKEWAHRPVG